MGVWRRVSAAVLLTVVSCMIGGVSALALPSAWAPARAIAATRADRVIDISGVKFKDITVTYDQSSYKPLVQGVPQGVEVSYSDGEHTDSGTYKYTATLTAPVDATFEDGTTKRELHATLTIKKAKSDGSIGRFDGSIASEFSSDPFVLYVGGSGSVGVYNPEPNQDENPISTSVVVSDSSVATIEETDDSGDYDVTAIKPGRVTLEIERKESRNYLAAKETIELTVVPRTIDVSEVVFNNQSAVYDGETHYAIIQNVPDGVRLEWRANHKDGYYLDSKSLNPGRYEKNTTLGNYVYDDSFVPAGSISYTVVLYAPRGTTFEDGTKERVFNATMTIEKAKRGLRVTPSPIELSTGKSVGLHLDYNDLDYSASFNHNAFSFESSDSSVAAYDKDSRFVMGKQQGKAVITVKVIGTDNYLPDEATVPVTVKQSVIDISKVSFPNATYTYDGMSHEFGELSGVPEGVEVIYDDDRWASYDEAGTYKLTVTLRAPEYNVFEDGKTERKLTSTLTIKKAKPDFKLQGADKELEVGYSDYLYLDGTYDYDSKVSWVSSTESVLKVVKNEDYDGGVNAQALKPGAATITATTSETKNYLSGSASVTITVVKNSSTDPDGPNKPDQNGDRIIRRLSGSSRYDTMGRINDKAFASNRGGWAVVASGENFPDALAASALAGKLDAPVVLTSKGSLSVQAAETLQRLGSTKVAVVGGTASVSEKAVGQIKKTGRVSSVTRVSGTSRLETARKVLEYGKGSWGKTAILATSGTFADALSVSSYAYTAKAPILLVNAGQRLDAPTLSALKSGGFNRVLIVGGTASVSSGAESQVRASGLSVRRLSGENRYSTSEQVADFAVKDGVLSVDNAVFATGESFPDALSGSGLGGQKHSVMLLVGPNGGAQFRTISWAAQHKKSMRDLYVLGGSNSIPSTVRTALFNQLGPIAAEYSN